MKEVTVQFTDEEYARLESKVTRNGQFEWYEAELARYRYHIEECERKCEELRRENLALIVFVVFIFVMWILC